MDQYVIKSVTFGGFDKQDVVRYIEEATRKADAEKQVLTDENAHLQAKVRSLNEENEALRIEIERLSSLHAQLQEQLQQETARLSAEAEALRPDAEAYAQFREKLGAIECDAHKRAADLEEKTAEQLRQTTDLFRQQYQIMMNCLETTSSHVTSELRKMEVTLSQLPRTMDQPGSELNTLAALLERFKSTEA